MIKKIYMLCPILFLSIVLNCESMMDDALISKKNHSELYSLFQISGEVISPWNVSSICVQLSGSSVEQTIQCDESGKFIFYDVPAGKYTVTPKSGDELFYPSEIVSEVIAGDCIGLRFELDSKEWQLEGMAGYNEEISSVLMDDDGFLAVGNSDYAGKGKDVYVVRVSRFGVKRWEKRIGGNGEEWGVKAVKSPEGGFFVLSNEVSTSSELNGLNVKIIYIDQSGSVLWDNTFGGLFLDEGADIVATSDGGALITGSSTSFSDSRNIFIAKFDSKGTSTGYRIFQSDSIDTSVAMIKDYAEDEYVIVGRSEDSGSAPQILVLRVKVHSLDDKKNDSDVKVLSRQILVSENAEYPSSIAADSGGNYFISGWMNKSMTCQPIIIEINGAADVIDRYLYPKAGGAAFCGLNSDALSGFILTGYQHNVSGSKRKDALIMEIDDNGVMISECVKTIYADSDNVLCAAFRPGANRMVLAGNRYSDIATSYFIRCSEYKR